jgi:hypothetical protein
MDQQFSQGFSDNSLGGFSDGFTGSRRFKKKKANDLNDPAFLAALAEKMGVKPDKPKAGALERVLGALSGIGSIPDAILNSQQNKSGVLDEYWKNVKQGFSTTFKGEKNPDGGFKGTSDLMKYNNLLGGDDLGSKVGRGVLGFVGDVLMDPTTYVTFGAGGVAKTAGQTGIKAVAKQGAKELVEEGAEALAKKAVTGAASKAGTNLLSTIGRAATSQGDDYLKVFGKTVTNNKAVVNTARALVNPLGTIASVGFKGAKQVAPEITQAAEDTFNKAFRAGKYEQSKGLGTLFNQTRNFTRNMDSLPERSIVQNADLLSKLKILPKEVQKNFAEYIEGTKVFNAGDFDQKIQKFLVKNNLNVDDLIKETVNSVEY